MGIPSTEIRVPSRLALILSIGLTPLIYVILRERYHPTGMAQQLFAWGVAVFSSFNFAFVARMGSFINANLPGWLKPFWMRFLAYMVLGMSLSLGVYFLALPNFYQGTINQGIIFCFMPYVLCYRTSQGWGFWPIMKESESSAPITLAFPRSSDEIVIDARRSTAFFLLLISLAFVLGALLLMRMSPLLASISICFVGLGIPIGASMLIPGAFRLILRRNEFVTISLWRRHTCRWSDVSDFKVVSLPNGRRMVAFNINHEALARGTRKSKVRQAMERMSSEMCGRNAALSPDYDIAPDELCALMVEQMTRAKSGPA